MVVCNTTLMQLPTACSITPVTPYLSGLCHLNTMPAIACNQRFSPIISAQMIAAPAPIPCPPGLPQTAAISCSPPAPSPHEPLTPPDSPVANCPPSNAMCNGVNLVPCTTSIVSLTNGVTSIVPFTQVPYTPKLVNSLGTTNSISTAQCNTGIYTCTQLPTTGVLQCTQRVVNGHSVLQCTPGVCPLTPAMLPTTPVEMIPSTTIVPNTPGMFQMTPSYSLPSNLCSPPAITAWKQSYGMEHVWQQEFKSLFVQYAPDNWMLFPITKKPEGFWNANVDSAKVRFCCEDCGHGWTSMKGRVAFWFVFNPASREGVVCLKLYGQVCDRCKTKKYEPAMWYPEEVIKVMVNIYNRVGQIYYGFNQPPYHRERRAGKPRTPHNSNLCQACEDGVCSERR